MNELKKILPIKLHEYLKNPTLEEIRIRKNKSIALRINGEILIINDTTVAPDEIEKIIQIATNYSFHTYLEYIKFGFITLKGGHRLGISGEVLLENNKIQNFKEISSINLRIAKNNIKINQNILKSTENKNTLIVSPPNLGKTTLLRLIIKHLSDAYNNISVIDERFEISGGNGRFDLGICTDILSGIGKSQGSMMMIRTMSPDYIVLDEITDDIEILKHILDCGVKIIATIHGDDLSSQKLRPIIKYFNNFIEISINNKKRIYKTLEGFYD